MRIFIYFFSHSFFLKYKITSKHFELDRALFDLVSFHILFFYSHIKVKKIFPKKKNKSMILYVHEPHKQQDVYRNKLTLIQK